MNKPLRILDNVVGIFHARRDPDWIQTQLLIREVRQS